MTVVSIVLSTVLAVAFLTFVAVMAWRVVRYAMTPAPLRIPTTPAPLTRAGAALRLAREVVLFESLFRADKVLWLFSMLFHVGLLLVLLRHLRYFVAEPSGVLVVLQPVGELGGVAMMVGLTGLLARRLILPRIRYITRRSDLAILVLLLALGASGFAMTLWFTPDIIALKGYLAGLWRLQWLGLPGDPMLVLHLLLFAALLVVAPFSKLLHAAGIFFSPTRYQRDNPRERRHLARWAKPLDSRRT